MCQVRDFAAARVRELQTDLKESNHHRTLLEAELRQASVAEVKCEKRWARMTDWPTGAPHTVTTRSSGAAGGEARRSGHWTAAGT